MVLDRNKECGNVKGDGVCPGVVSGGKHSWTDTNSAYG